jgi:murein L,D-transpeptidase YcbB/YkuD
MTRSTFFPTTGARRWPGVVAVLCAALLAGPVLGESAVEVIRERIATLQANGRIEVRGVTIGSDDVLPAFYARREFAPAWTDDERIDALLAAFAAAGDDGLDPEDYFLSRLRELRDEAGQSLPSGELDLILTEALVRFAYHQRFGKVNPATMDPNWNFAREFAPGTDPVTLFDGIVAADAPADAIARLIPRGPWYRQLQQALARHRQIAASGGWPEVLSGATLRPGERDARVLRLRERLSISGDLAPGPSPVDAELFDDELARALRHFQQRHALAADGVLGRNTLAALNVPVGYRIEQLRMSLERARWVSASVPADFVAVNIASFEAGLVRGGELVWSSRVVVGRFARQTPIFRGDMTYLVLNPTWTVPPTILRKDVLPKIKKDIGYLRRENIRVLDRNGREVNPAGVNWAAYTKGAPYTFRQDPGPANSLGRIKFMFPNEHAVYLHDTPAKQLFDKPERTFSSGCIRVEDPLRLAELLLDDPAWTRAALEAAIATGETRTVRLRRAMPVLLLYWTALADADGTVRFFRDVYGRDARLLAALNGPVRVDLPRSR